MPRIWLGARSSGSGEENSAQYLWVIEGQFGRLDAGQALEHVDHGRVIVTEHVELDEDIVQRAEVKVRRDDVGFLVVRGVLRWARTDRSSYSAGTMTMPARVLAGGALDAHAARRQAVHFRARSPDGPCPHSHFLT